MPLVRGKMPGEQPPRSAKRPRSTLQQIAAACDVSIATVSRVLNEPERVKPATRKRILDAVRELGYARSFLLAG